MTRKIEEDQAEAGEDYTSLFNDPEEWGTVSIPLSQAATTVTPLLKSSKRRTVTLLSAEGRSGRGNRARGRPKGSKNKKETKTKTKTN